MGYGRKNKKSFPVPHCIPNVTITSRLLNRPSPADARPGFRSWEDGSMRFGTTQEIVAFSNRPAAARAALQTKVGACRRSEQIEQGAARRPPDRASTAPGVDVSRASGRDIQLKPPQRVALRRSENRPRLHGWPERLSVSFWNANRTRLRRGKPHDGVAAVAATNDRLSLFTVRLCAPSCSQFRPRRGSAVAVPAARNDSSLVACVCPARRARRGRPELVQALCPATDRSSASRGWTGSPWRRGPRACCLEAIRSIRTYFPRLSNSAIS